MERDDSTVGESCVAVTGGFSLPALIYAGICCALFTWMYFPAYTKMFEAWEGGNYDYCYLIPVIVLYILWENRAALRNVPISPSLTGLAPLCLGVVLFWLGELGGEYYTLFFSSWFVMLGMAWIYLGRNMLKAAAFPLCFLITMFPFPNMINNNLNLRLKLLSSELGVAMIRAYGMSAYREGNVIDVGFTQLQVVDACSGLRYFLPLIVLGILLAYYFRAALWKRIALVLIAVPLSIITNSLRIASVGILYQFWGPAAAEGFFHDFSGWFIFMSSLAMLLAAMWCLKRIFPEPATVVSIESEHDPAPICGGYRKIGLKHSLLLAVPALLLLGGSTLASNTIDFREKIPLRRSFSGFPVQIGEWRGERQAIEKIYLDELGLSDYLLIDYRDAQLRNINLYVAYNESQRGGKSSHSPASCLPGNGWAFMKSGISEVELSGGKVIKVQRALMENNGQQQLVYYWFPQRGRVLHNLFELKLYAFRDALVYHRTDGALVRIITPVSEDGNPSQAELRLKAFVTQILPVLDQYLPGKPL